MGFAVAFVALPFLLHACDQTNGFWMIYRVLPINGPGPMALWPNGTTLLSSRAVDEK